MILNRKNKIKNLLIIIKKKFKKYLKENKKLKNKK